MLFVHHSYTMDPVEEDLRTMRKDVESIVSVLSPELARWMSGKEFAAVEKNPYKNTDAYVRHGSCISQGEKDYLKNRLPIVKSVLEKLLKQEIANNEIPTIAMINSGGGYRAMFYTIGSLCGAEKIGLLDTTTYVTGLSGSTWALAPWVSTTLTLPKFKEYMIGCAQKSFSHPTDQEELLIFDASAIKHLYNQARTPVDLYGDLLGNRLLEHFGKKRHMVYPSQQSKIIEEGKYPYPIYTAIDANEAIVRDQAWYEFTPHEIGNPLDNLYIPTWAFGRKFKQGVSTKDTFTTYPPEKNLSYHMGTYGSAFGANIWTIKHELAKSLGYEHFLETVLTCMDGERPFDFYAKVPSYKYKMDAPAKHTSKFQCFVDAGTDFNLPISPVSGLSKERKADVLIICDASAGVLGIELQKASDYMKKHQLPFPKINIDRIDKSTITIFSEQDPNIPVVIYMPRISDPELHKQNLSLANFNEYQNLAGFDLDRETNNGFASTIHFQYDPANAIKVVNQAEFNMRVNQARIIEALKFAVKRKKQLS